MTKQVRLDLGALVTGIDPRGRYFGRDKVEGVAVFDHGKRLLVSNDNDFGISGITNDAPPFQLETKTLPDGRQDDGEMLMVDVARLRHLSRR